MEINEGSKINPRIVYSEKENTIEISGWSFCEKPMEIYQPIFEIVKTMVRHREESININFKLKCFNTATTKSLFELLKLVSDETTRFKKSFVINWFYLADDPETKEWGEDLSVVSGIDFRYMIVENSL